MSKIKNEDLTQEEIEVIRKRVEAASKGPWLQYTRGNYEDSVVWGPMGPGYGKICEVFLNYAQKPRISDADFIANAREDIPKLLAEVDRLRAQNSELLEYNRYYLAENKRLKAEIKEDEL